MKVYAIEYNVDGSSDDRVIGTALFTTRESAEAHRVSCEEDYTDTDYNFQVVELEVNN